MSWIVTTTVRFIRAVKLAFTKLWSFLAISVIVFVGMVYLLAALDLLPDTKVAPSISLSSTMLQPAATTTPIIAAVVSDLPVKIVIPSINLEATIANPTTADADVLDADLLKGAVRYPTSAKLGEDGNMVLFGHSSYLPVVHNLAYKTFDGIQNLTAGKVVTVYSADTAYTYRVRTVTKESATTAGIPLQVSGRVLTLSTCDSFGEKTDRFVVVADFVDSYSISN